MLSRPDLVPFEIQRVERIRERLDDATTMLEALANDMDTEADKIIKSGHVGVNNDINDHLAEQQLEQYCVIGHAADDAHGSINRVLDCLDGIDRPEDST
jgi:hypothetical protein